MKSNIEHLYEELRKATDGGSESMTHDDALKQIEYWRNRCSAIPNSTGGPAFPFGVGFAGMTLRDYFAAKALPYVVDHCTTRSRSAEEAYKIADAMLEARKL